MYNRLYYIIKVWYIMLYCIALYEPKHFGAPRDTLQCASGENPGPRNSSQRDLEGGTICMGFDQVE